MSMDDIAQVNISIFTILEPYCQYKVIEYTNLNLDKYLMYVKYSLFLPLSKLLTHVGERFSMASILFPFFKEGNSLKLVCFRWLKWMFEDI